LLHKVSVTLAFGPINAMLAAGDSGNSGELLPAGALFWSSTIDSRASKATNKQVPQPPGHTLRLQTEAYAVHRTNSRTSRSLPGQSAVIIRIHLRDGNLQVRLLIRGVKHALHRKT